MTAHKTAIDWESKPEPLRSIGLAFVNDLRRIVGEPSPIRPDEIPDQTGVLLFARRVRAKLRVCHGSPQVQWN